MISCFHKSQFENMIDCFAMMSYPPLTLPPGPPSSLSSDSRKTKPLHTALESRIRQGENKWTLCIGILIKYQNRSNRFFDVYHGHSKNFSKKSKYCLSFLTWMLWTISNSCLSPEGGEPHMYILSSN